MATENILMSAVKKGGDRQELHEKIRVHSMEAAKVVKTEGKPNDLVSRIAADDSFDLTISEINDILLPENFIGRAPEQTTEFLNEVVRPILDENPDYISGADLSV